jgi:hypothetical protein
VKHQERFGNILGMGLIWNFLKEFGDSWISFNEYVMREGLMCTEIMGICLCSSFASGFGVMQKHLDESFHHVTMKAVLYLKNDAE